MPRSLHGGHRGRQRTWCGDSKLDRGFVSWLNRFSPGRLRPLPCSVGSVVRKAMIWMRWRGGSISLWWPQGARQGTAYADHRGHRVEVDSRLGVGIAGTSRDAAPHARRAQRKAAELVGRFETDPGFCVLAQSVLSRPLASPVLLRVLRELRGSRKRCLGRGAKASGSGGFLERQGLTTPSRGARCARKLSGLRGALETARHFRRGHVLGTELSGRGSPTC